MNERKKKLKSAWNADIDGKKYFTMKDLKEKYEAK